MTLAQIVTSWAEVADDAILALLIGFVAWLVFRLIYTGLFGPDD